MQKKTDKKSKQHNIFKVLNKNNKEQEEIH